MTKKYLEPTAEELEKQCKALADAFKAMGFYPIDTEQDICPHCGKPIHGGTE